MTSDRRRDERAALTAAQQILRRAGIGNAAREARWLLDAVAPDRRATDSLNAVEMERYETLVARRANREPLQHILGRAAFRYLHLRVGPGVFVPRPETETLVDLVLDRVAAAGHQTLVDLGSGSGAIALALATENAMLDVTAVEKAPEAMRWLDANLAEQTAAVRSRVHPVLGDIESTLLRTALAGLAGAVDVVVSNPPYVPQATSVEPEVGHDPPAAVFAGEDGLALMPALIELARFLLRPGGLIAIEHSETHAGQLRDKLCKAGWHDVRSHDDLTERPRFVTARCGS